MARVGPHDGAGAVSVDRRDAMKSAAIAALGLATPLPALAGPATAATASAPRWKRGLDNQRIADLGDGTFLNPVLAGDRPDPAILKDGKDYYLTFSSFESYPGLDRKSVA